LLSVRSQKYSTLNKSNTLKKNIDFFLFFPEVNADQHLHAPSAAAAVGASLLKKSPMTKLVRLAKLAASTKDGIIAVGIGAAGAQVRK
jgi:hypothetical protein